MVVKSGYSQESRVCITAIDSGGHLKAVVIRLLAYVRSSTVVRSRVPFVPPEESVLVSICSNPTLSDTVKGR